jgi:prephenate dehydrogenase
VSATPLISRLAIIGVGLIGGSLSLALKRAGQVGEAVGYGRSAANLQDALRLGVIDRIAASPAEAVADADMVIVAVPLGAMQATFEAIRPALSPQAIITDVGSAKASVIAAARAGLGECLPRFVAGHPIAGAEKTGAAAAQAELFQNRRVILTPSPETLPAALEKTWQMWQAAGAEVLDMAADEHDRLLAATSHLPHLLAFALVEMLARRPPQEDIFRFAGTGFRDFSRIAASDPVMWRDICISNRAALLDALNQYRAQLDSLAVAIETSDGAALQALFQAAKTSRDSL